MILDEDSERVRLRPAHTTDALADKGGVLVYRGVAAADLETAVQQQRRRRADTLSGSASKPKG